jgi:hypothetical protein
VIADNPLFWLAIIDGLVAIHLPTVIGIVRGIESLRPL